MRYIVDDRCGCVAVRDTSLIDPEQPGLHGDEEDCIQFWAKGRRKTQCEHCLHVSEEYIADDHVEEAKALAEKLNNTKPRALCKYRGMLVVAEVTIREDGTTGQCPECRATTFTENGDWTECDCGFAYLTSDIKRLIPCAS